MLRVGPRLENEPDFREWTPAERESYRQEQAEKLRKSGKFQILKNGIPKDLKVLVQ